MFITDNPDALLPEFRYQDQLQEIFLMGRKEAYFIRKCLEFATSTHRSQLPIMAENVKFGLENNSHPRENDQLLSVGPFLSKLKLVKYMEIDNCLIDDDLLTLSLTCHNLVKLKISGNLISNQGIHYLTFADSSCPHDSLEVCRCDVESSIVPLKLRDLDINGLRNINKYGVWMLFRGFKTLSNIICRNKLLCDTIESASVRYVTDKKYEWNSNAIKKLEFGLKHKIVFSIFEKPTGKL